MVDILINTFFLGQSKRKRVGNDRRLQEYPRREYPRRFCEELLLSLQDDEQTQLQSHAVHCVLTIETLNTQDEKTLVCLRSAVMRT